MAIFSKLVCMAVGHVPFPKSNVEEIPKKKQQTHNFIFGPFIGTTGVGAMYNYVSAQLHQSISYPILQMNASPFEVKFTICKRCHQLYWKTDLQTTTLCNVNKIPELEEFKKIKERNIWEENQRKNNLIAESLYKQYLMTLKLCYDDDENNEAKDS